MCFPNGGGKHEESIITTQLLGIDFLCHNDWVILDCMPKTYNQSQVVPDDGWYLSDFTWLDHTSSCVTLDSFPGIMQSLALTLPKRACVGFSKAVWNIRNLNSIENREVFTYDTVLVLMYTCQIAFIL